MFGNVNELVVLHLVLFVNSDSSCMFILFLKPSITSESDHSSYPSLGKKMLSNNYAIEDTSNAIENVFNGILLLSYKLP